MVRRPLGRSGLEVTAIGFGAFKIGRNTAVKYSESYPLPTEDEATELLHAALDLGINYVDTAPAYGVSEARIGRAIGHRTDVVISTKVGELHNHGESRYDFSAAAMRTSVEESRRRLRRDSIDLLFLHCPHDDLPVLRTTDAVATLQALKLEGAVRSIGFSGKSVAAAMEALNWADAIMVEYHLDDRSHAGVIASAIERGVGVIVKKGLASGRLDPAAALEFLLTTQGVASVVVGSLSASHLTSAVEIARRSTK